MLKRIALLVIAVGMALAVFVIAGEKKDAAAEKEASADKDALMHAEHTSFDGTLVCLGCSLKKAEGARSACKEFGHTHALMTSDGKYVSFLENKFSSDLVKGDKYHEKEISAHGIFYASANVLDVETFEIDGKKMGWCDHCASMDNCAYKGEKVKTD